MISTEDVSAKKQNENKNGARKVCDKNLHGILTRQQTNENWISFEIVVFIRSICATHILALKHLCELYVHLTETVLYWMFIGHFKCEWFVNYTLRSTEWAFHWLLNAIWNGQRRLEYERHWHLISYLFYRWIKKMWEHRLIPICKRFFIWRFFIWFNYMIDCACAMYGYVCLTTDTTKWMWIVVFEIFFSELFNLFFSRAFRYDSTSFPTFRSRMFEHSFDWRFNRNEQKKVWNSASGSIACRGVRAHTFIKRQTLEINAQ